MSRRNTVQWPSSLQCCSFYADMLNSVPFLAARALLALHTAMMGLYDVRDDRCHTLGYLLLKCVRTVRQAPISFATISASSVVLWRFFTACKLHTSCCCLLNGEGPGRDCERHGR